MEKIKINLEFGLEIDGVEVSELELRRPTVQDIKLANSQAGGDEEKASFALIANLCMITKEQVEDLDIGVDFKTVQRVLTGIMNDESVSIDKSKSRSRSVRIDLKHPIKDGSKEINFIELKRPKVKDYQFSEQAHDEYDKPIRLLSRVSGLTESQINKMDYGTDYAHAREYLQLFLGVGQP